MKKKTNDFLVDVVFSKFSDLLGGFEDIEDSESLCSELSKDVLLRRDVKKVAEVITPYIPLLGMISGGFTTL